MKTNKKIYDIIIIGAGVVGCMIARELSQYNVDVLVLEKDNDVCNETSAANSAIIHSGYDPLPNTLKAKLNVLGNAMFDKISSELDVSFKRIGSITLAFNEDDINTLKMLQKRGEENGVVTKLLDYKEVHELEPLLSPKVIGGLYASSAGIINPFTLCVHAMENAIDNGVTLILNEEVKTISKENDIYNINDKHFGKIIINAAGINADDINLLVNKGKDEFTLLPRKGEYIVLNHFKAPFVSHTLFMVPSNKGKGVLISPTTSNNYLIGPSADLVYKDDNTTQKDIINIVKKQAENMICNIPYNETIRVFAGIRATPETHDFIIKESMSENFINVAGIESPGLVSSPAIAKMVVDEIVSKKINLVKKDNYNPYVRKYVHVDKLSFEEKNKLYQENKDYASIVCKCEKVSKGEIIDCLNRSCPPFSIKGLKKRLRVGFGKCQGGMCQSEALSIMASFYNVDKKDILYDNKNSNILLKKMQEED
ncbi:MAG: FAD-dependent oxidoreductase [Erysipelotrichaceae bacterium]|nr:FAD-dependent oxidoreductase [Erysipelotrichaceae bacterium]